MDLVSDKIVLHAFEIKQSQAGPSVLSVHFFSFFFFNCQVKHDFLSRSTKALLKEEKLVWSRHWHEAASWAQLCTELIQASIHREEQQQLSTPATAFEKQACCHPTTLPQPLSPCTLYLFLQSSMAKTGLESMELFQLQSPVSGNNPVFLCV